MPASQYLTAYRWVLYDSIRSKFTPALARCRALEAQALFTAGRPVSACRHLAEASRLANSSYAPEVRRRWSDFERAFPDLVTGDVSRETASGRSIVLRVPGRSAAGSWKGILLIKFTATFSYYFRNVDFKRLTRDYHVFLEPSWMGYCDPDILFWGQAGNPVFVEASEVRDRKFLVDLNDLPFDNLTLSDGSQALFVQVHKLRASLDVLRACGHPADAVRDLGAPSRRVSDVAPHLFARCGLFLGRRRNSRISPPPSPARSTGPPP